MTTGNLWGTTTPTDVNIDNGPEVWLGTVLTFSVSGWVTKARFYKGSSNTGTHVARLWRMSDGAVLGSVTFSGETSSGWQEQAFASAIPVASGTQYCIGYHSPTGFFSRNANYFGAAAFTNGQITGLQSASVTPGVSGNGRYREDTAASTALLDSAFNHTAYFADVEFTDTDPAPTPALAPLGWFSADLLAGSWFAPDLYLAGWGDDEAVNTVTGPLTAPVDPQQPAAAPPRPPRTSPP